MQSGKHSGRQAGSREGQKGWEEGRKEGRKSGGQECRQTGIQADRIMYRKTDVQIYILCHTANKVDLLVLLSKLTRLESCCTVLLNLLRKDLGTLAQFVGYFTIYKLPDYLL
jgi:hypothetical protein